MSRWDRRMASLPVDAIGIAVAIIAGLLLVAYAWQQCAVTQ